MAHFLFSSVAPNTIIRFTGRMAELADAYGLGPYGEILKGSSPFPSIFAAAFGRFSIFRGFAYTGLRPLEVLLTLRKIEIHPKILAKN